MNRSNDDVQWLIDHYPLGYTDAELEAYVEKVAVLIADGEDVDSARELAHEMFFGV